MFTNHYLLGHTAVFLDKDFLSFAGVNSAALLAWEDRPKVTCYMNKFTTRRLLEFAFINGLEKSVNVCAEAANKALPDMLVAAVGLGCPLGPSVCAAAASKGHLAFIQYARELGCAWCDKTCIEAASSGQLHVLKWCAMNGAPLCDAVVIMAKIRRDEDLLEWLQQTFPTLLNITMVSLLSHLHVLLPWLQVK